jgi:hypothetical protein
LRLCEAGIKCEAELRRIGAAKAYQPMAAQSLGRRLPVCGDEMTPVEEPLRWETCAYTDVLFWIHGMGCSSD